MFPDPIPAYNLKLKWLSEMWCHCEVAQQLAPLGVVEGSGQLEGFSVPSPTLWGKPLTRSSPTLCPLQQGRDPASSSLTNPFLGRKAGDG